MLVPHHAAWTACVTWTNLYFEVQYLLKGDFIGGPLEKLFGAGIQDIPVTTDVWGGWFAHIRYWTRNEKNPKADTRKSAAIHNLKKAIDRLGKGYRPAPPAQLSNKISNKISNKS